VKRGIRIYFGIKPNYQLIKYKIFKTKNKKKQEKNKEGDKKLRYVRRRIMYV